MSSAKVTGLFRAIAGEAKAAGSTYFAPARAAAKAISDMAHADVGRGRSVTTPSGRAMPASNVHSSILSEVRSRKK